MRQKGKEMRIEVAKFGIKDAKACLVRKSDFGDVEILLKDGRKISSWGFEGIRSEGEEIERIEFASGDVLYRVA